jgi:hypothetical protein
LDTEKWKGAYTDIRGAYTRRNVGICGRSPFYSYSLIDFLSSRKSFFVLEKEEKGGISRFILFDSEAYSSSYLSSPLSSLKRPKSPVY